MLARFVLLLFLCTASGAVKAETPTPRGLVEGFQATLIEVMKEARQLGVKGRFARLTPAIEAAFHVPLMTQIAAGNYWTGTSPDERQRLIEAFQRMSVGTLATLFDGYSGERFEIKGEAAGPQGTQIVKTLLVKKDRSTNDIAYVAKRIRNRWYLVDVVVDEGISELSVRRSEYARVLRDGGVPHLIAVLNAKSAELLSQTAEK